MISTVSLFMILLRKRRIMKSEVAERYAEGLFDLAKENGTVEEKKDQAEELIRQFDENENLELFFRAVKITREEKKKFIADVLGREADQDVVHFLELIIDKGRSFYIRQILEAYTELADGELGIVRGTVASARPLKDEDLKEIKEALQKKTGKKYILRNKIDPSLIAGIKVTTGSQVVDLTMKTKIEDMKNTLLKGGQA